MHIDELKKSLRAEPFRPLRIHMADGRSFDVPHPEFLAIPPDGRRTAVLFFPGEDGLEILDATMISSVRVAGGEPGGASDAA